MKYRSYVAPLITITLLLSGCKKESDKSFDCERFKQGVIANDKDRIVTALGALLTSYSRENVEKLAGAVSRQCNMNVTVLCFDCIYTIPAQTEVKVSFTQGGASIDKVLDISYNSRHKMTIVRVHD